MAHFDRHPVNILIEVSANGQSNYSSHSTSNLSTGGLAFRCDRRFEPDSILAIRITLVNPPFEAEARVAWCAERKGHFETGVEFLKQDDAFMAHMVEQVCQIENYMKEILRKEGRKLSPEEAANEWSSKYAARFPGSEEPQ